MITVSAVAGIFGLPLSIATYIVTSDDFWKVSGKIKQKYVF